MLPFSCCLQKSLKYFIFFYTSNYLYFLFVVSLLTFDLICWFRSAKVNNTLLNCIHYQHTARTPFEQPETLTDQDFTAN